MARPLLEYASEIWSGQLPADAERVQMTLYRGTLGLHANGSGVSDHGVRAKAGVEPLADQRAKPKLGYW